MDLLNITLGVIQFVLILFTMLKEAEKKSPTVFLWATLFLMFGLPHLITSVIDDFDYPQYIICSASLFVIFFCLIYLLIRRRSKCQFVVLDTKFGIAPDRMENTVFELICFVLFLVSFAVTIIGNIHAVGGFLNASWASSRAVERNYVDITGLTSRLMFAFSGLSLYFFLTKRKKIAAFILFLFLFFVLIKKSRSDLLPVIIFFVTFYLIRMKKIRLKDIVLGATMGVAVIYVVYGIRALRWLGSNANVLDNFSWEYINSRVMQFLHERNGELGLRQYFYYFIYKDNNFDGFNQCASYIRMLLVFVPSRFAFGLKPESFDLTMGQAIGMAPGGSMHPTLFGDCFGNLWWFGILLGAFWALIANITDKLISRQPYSLYKILLFFVTAHSFVLIGRGSVYNGFQIAAWGILFIFFLKLFLHKLEHIHIHLRSRKQLNQERNI